MEKLTEILKELEDYRESILYKNEPSDHVIRVCEAIVAKKAGYENRMEWKNPQRTSERGKKA